MTAVLTDEQRETVQANVPLVEHIVNRVAASLPSAYTRDDLVQTGIMGLISATLRFDPEVGASFATFAGRRIEGAIVDLLRSSDWAPRSIRSLERQLNSAEERLANRRASSTSNQRGRSDEIEADLARMLNCTPAEVVRLRQNIAKARLDSLDRSMALGGESSTLADSIADGAKGTEELIDDRELHGYLRNGVALLPERHRVVIIGFFFHNRSMTDLGQFLGVSQSRASQLKEEALQMLRAGMDEAYDQSDTDQQVSLTKRQRKFAEAVADSKPFSDRPISQLA